MGSCQLCKKRVELPFRCNYCGQLFCAEHRLPENHLCSALPIKREWSSYKKIRGQKWGLKEETKKVPSKPVPISNVKNENVIVNTNKIKIEKEKINTSVSAKKIIFLVVVGACLVFYFNNPIEFTDYITTLPLKISILFSEVSSEVNSSIDEAEIQDRQTRQEFLLEIEFLIFEYANEERVNQGIKELIWDEDLAEIARRHSRDMANNDFYSHINLDGEDPTDRAKKYGYKTYKSLGGGWYSDGIAENIAKMPTGNVVDIGYVSDNPESIAKALVESWMDSPGHRENILDIDYNKLGVGISYDGIYYIATQDFW